jgi:RIO kinase 1
MREEERVCNYIKEEKLKNHFLKVFDERTVLAVHRLANRGFLENIEFLVNEGKEAAVFRAVDKKGNFVAVKVYKIETSGFRKMHDYLHGDPRFKGITRDKRSVVYAWTKKEYRNLELAVRAGLDVPLPVAFFENCLVMEFIGKDGNAAKMLKDAKPQDMKEAYRAVVAFVAGLYKAGLVHADLSEYNILNDTGRLVVIDMGQAVSRRHPEAKRFFERDAGNLAAYFSKAGLEKGKEEFMADVRALAGG